MALLARDIMETDVRTVSPATSIAELGDDLLTHRIGGMPVVERGELVGIVSRSDIVRAASLERTLAGVASEGIDQSEFAPAEVPDPVELLRGAVRAVESRTVRDVMTTEPVTVETDTPVVAVARLLVERHLHRVIVVDGRRVRGVISSLDLAQLIADGTLVER
jgi:CBS domain-containing protein